MQDIRIRNDIRVAEAFTHGNPVRFYAPKSRAAAHYAEIVIGIDK
jgi:chromosome partitioning protein